MIPNHLSTIPPQRLVSGFGAAARYGGGLVVSGHRRYCRDVHDLSSSRRLARATNVLLGEGTSRLHLLVARCGNASICHRGELEQVQRGASMQGDVISSADWYRGFLRNSRHKPLDRQSGSISGAGFDRRERERAMRCPVCSCSWPQSTKVFSRGAATECSHHCNSR
jgi:hypothetical protein